MQSIRTEEIYDNDDPDKEWEVEKILKERVKSRKNQNTGKMELKKEYLVKWVGFEDTSWEPEENLEHSQELLKDFLIKQIMKKVKGDNNFLSKTTKKMPKNAQKASNKIAKSARKRKFGEIKNIDEPSTLSNSQTNDAFPKDKKKNNIIKNNEEGLTVCEVKEEDENLQYDIEILDEKKNDNNNINHNNDYNENENKNPENSNFSFNKNSKEFEKSPEEYNENTSNFQNEIKENDNIQNNVNIIDINLSEENINANNLNDIPKFSQTIYIDDNEEGEDFKEEEVNNKIVEKIIETPKTEKFLGRKRFNLNSPIEIGTEHNEDKNKIKVISINGIKVPENFEEGIKLNIKYKLNNKIYIDEFDTHSDKIPTSIIFKYYEMFICEYFQQGDYYRELYFD